MSSPPEIPKARIAFASIGVTTVEVLLVGLATIAIPRPGMAI